jgi:hypothetical protein
MDERGNRFFDVLFGDGGTIKVALRESGIGWEEYVELREGDEEFRERWRKYEVVRNERAREQGNWVRKEMSVLLRDSLEAGDKRASILANAFLKSLDREMAESEKGSMGLLLEGGEEYGEGVAMENLRRIQEASIRGRRLDSAIKAETLKMKANNLLDKKGGEVVHKIDLSDLRRFVEERRERMPVIEGECIEVRERSDG